MSRDIEQQAEKLVRETHREAIARLLCEQHGGDPDAVASEPHDCWEGPLWTAFTKEADAILKLLATAPQATPASQVLEAVSTERVKELEAALLPFAADRLSTEPTISDLLHRSPAEQLRVRAGETELRDAQILKARATLGEAHDDGR